MFEIGVIGFCIGFVILGIATLNFRWRALRNKQAWNGITIPFTIVGLIVLIGSLICIYIYYPI